MISEATTLIEALIEGRLDTAGRRRLAQLAADPAVAADLRQQVGMSNMLRLHLSTSDAQAQAERIVTVALSNRHSRRIAAAHAITRRIRDRGVAMRPRRSRFPRQMIGLCVAACLVLAAFLTVIQFKSHVPTQSLTQPAAPAQPLSQNLAQPPSQHLAQPQAVRAVAVAEMMSGQALLRDGSALVAGSRLDAGEDFTVADEARLTLADGTTLLFTAGRYCLASAPAGILVRMDVGTVTAEVTPQLPGRSLRFVSPEAMATVLGTLLSLRVDRDGTRLEVTRGRVHLRGLKEGPDGGLVVIAGGNAVVGPDARLIRAAALPLRPALQAASIGTLVGLNVRLGEGTAAEDRRFDELLPRLTSLGIRQLRVDVQNTSGAVVDHWRKLAALGFEVCAVVKDPDADPALLPNHYGGALRMLAGPHEPDRIDPAFTMDALRVSLASLAKRMRVVTPNLRLVGPTFVDPGMNTRLGDCSAFFDAIAFSHMLSGHHPETDGWGDDGYGSVTWALRQAAGAGPRLPVVLARAGYHDAVQADSNHRGVPDDVLAVYLPRLVMAYAAAGVQRAYLAELIDREAQGITGALGLLRRDGTPKPAFTALRDLLAVCADRGAGTASPSFPIALPPEDACRSLLLARRDGSCVLALWLPSPCWDPSRSEPLAVAPRTVRVRLNGPGYRLTHQVIGHGPAGMLTLIASEGNAYVDIPISDRLSVVEITVDNTKLSL